ncbi:c-type cytochrome [Aquabacterium sp.]|uniref:c-type cytochrome n=1 Tax=Aquabacterium sp. TaxID=1872578 RepID=UPI002B79F303|nr:cytochrome c [Aquabacterium sp.]HSW06771.1 cytochrome c [Aquabacterium sp.]
MSAVRTGLVPLVLVACFAQAALAQPAPTTAGKRLFDARCGICHGRGGTGSFMLAKRLGQDKALLAERSDLSADYVKAIVRNGILSMPGLTRGELADTELEVIAAYLERPASERTARPVEAPK